MRLLLASLVVTFAVAVTASVFAIWPVVADAPWVEIKETETIIERQVPATKQALCQSALEGGDREAIRRFCYVQGLP